MGIIVLGSGQSSNVGLIDIVEGWNGFHCVLTGNPQGQINDLRSVTDIGAGGSTSVLFPNISGAIGALSFDATMGRTTHNWTSIAAASSLSGGVGAGGFGFPWWQRFSTPAARVSAVFFPRPFRRYRVDYLVRGILLGAADVCVGIASNAAGAMPTGGPNNDPFVAWVGRSVLNGGAWTPRMRLVGAGAFVDGPSSGVAFVNANVTRQLSIIYEEGLIPRIRWLIDGREVHQIAGDANMPNATASCFVAKAMGPGAGLSQASFAETRYRVEEI